MIPENSWNGLDDVVPYHLRIIWNKKPVENPRGGGKKAKVPRGYQPPDRVCAAKVRWIQQYLVTLEDGKKVTVLGKDAVAKMFNIGKSTVQGRVKCGRKIGGVLIERGERLPWKGGKNEYPNV